MKPIAPPTSVRQLIDARPLEGSGGRRPREPDPHDSRRRGRPARRSEVARRREPSCAGRRDAPACAGPAAPIADELSTSRSSPSTPTSAVSALERIDRRRGAVGDRAARPQQGGGAPRARRSFVELEEAGAAAARSARRAMSADDRQRAVTSAASGRGAGRRWPIRTRRRRRWPTCGWRGPSCRPTSTSTRRSAQQFECGQRGRARSDCRAAAGARRRTGARGQALAREQADRVAIVARDRAAGRTGRARSDRRAAGAVGRPAADAVGIRGVADAPVPGCLAARSRIASAAGCWPKPRPAGSRRWPPSSNSCWRPISRSRKWSRAGADCAATPTCCASMRRPTCSAAERLERAVAALEEKEHEYQQARAKQEQDNLRRLQQICRQVETLAADGADHAEGRRSRAARDPSGARGARRRSRRRRIGRRSRRGSRRRAPTLAPRVQELRDADEWQRWANLQVQEELCQRDGGAQGRGEPRGRRPPHARAAGALEAGGAWRRARRARRCGGASRPRRTRSSRARPRTSRRRTKSAPATWRASRRCASRPRRWPTRPTGSRRPPRFRRCRPSGRRSARSRADTRRRSGSGSAPPAIGSSRAVRRISSAARKSGRQPRAQGSAVREGRGAGRFHRVGQRRRAVQAAAGRVEDDRSGPQVEVGSDLAALPRRLRSVLRSLQASRSGRAAGEGRAFATRSSASSKRCVPPDGAAESAAPENLYTTVQQARSQVAAGAGAAARAAAGSGRAVSPGRRPARRALARRVCRHRSRSRDDAQAHGEAAGSRSRSSSSAQPRAAGQSVADRAARAAVARAAGRQHDVAAGTRRRERRSRAGGRPSRKCAARSRSGCASDRCRRTSPGRSTSASSAPCRRFYDSRKRAS